MRHNPRRRHGCRRGIYSKGNIQHRRYRPDPPWDRPNSRKGVPIVPHEFQILLGRYCQIEKRQWPFPIESRVRREERFPPVPTLATVPQTVGQRRLVHAPNRDATYESHTPDRHPLPASWRQFSPMRSKTTPPTGAIPSTHVAPVDSIPICFCFFGSSSSSEDPSSCSVVVSLQTQLEDSQPLLHIVQKYQPSLRSTAVMTIQPPAYSDALIPDRDR
eukprot:scaffold411130_cov47-Attheya_sp.AAC.4